MPTWPSMIAFVSDLNASLDEDDLKKVTRKQAKEAQKIADRAAAKDLGEDRAFSGWRRNDRIALDTKIRPGRGGVTLLTPNRSSAGPWTVAERGRNQGGTSSFLGPGANRKTGETARTKSGRVRKVRAFKAKRWNGYTRGKSTASDAVKQMERDLPDIADAEVRRLLAKRFDLS